MLKKAKVVRFENDGKILVLPFSFASCRYCNRETCGEIGKFFYAENAAGVDLKVGDVVEMEISAENQAWEALLAIGLPIAGAFSGWFLGGRIGAGEESCRVIGIVAGFFGCAALVAFLRAFIAKSSLPKIVAVE